MFKGTCFSILFFFLVCQVKLTFAQDIHFSQYYASPLNLNPAKAGYFMGSHRFAANYKNQWRSVTVPYRTFSGSFDMPVVQRGHRQDMFGAGAVINTDKAGDANYGTTQLNLAFSYIKGLNKYNNHFFSVAVQPGFSQRSFDRDKLFFDSQHDGTSYDPNLPHGEHIKRDNFIFFDLSLGLYWNHQPFDNLGFDAGLAVFHVNKPNQTLYDDPSTILNRKILFFANSVFEAFENIDAIPGIFYARQGNFQEFIIGSNFRYIKSPNPINYTSFNMGLFFRAKDAAIIVAGFDYLQYNFGVSYDVNYSGLTPASRHMGGLELSFKYILDTHKSYIRKTPCPIF